MNAAHLQNPAFRDQIVALWNERSTVATTQSWSDKKLLLSCMRGTRAVDRCWGKRRAVERKARAIALQARLASAQVALESAPDSSRLQTEVQAAVELLCSFEKALGSTTFFKNDG